MQSVTIRISDEAAAAIDARAAELSSANFVRVGRAACVRAAVDAFLSRSPAGDRPSGLRPLPPRRNRISA